MSNYLNLKDLANELDTLREQAEEPLDDDENDKLAELIAIEDELGDLHVYSKNIDSTLIPQDEFEDHIKDEVEDTCDLGAAMWLADYIDWERLADDRQCDYNTVVYQSDEYYIRAR